MCEGERVTKNSLNIFTMHSYACPTVRCHSLSSLFPSHWHAEGGGRGGLGVARRLADKSESARK